MGTRRSWHEYASTQGGQRLQALRKHAGKTQLVLEADAGLGCGYMQRIESGKVRQPERSTLERILHALDASYGEGREILGLFGYLIPTQLPTEADVAWARAACHDDLQGVPFPAYVLDCRIRLLAWNHQVPCLFPIVADAADQLATEHWSMFRLWLDPRYGVTGLVHNPATVFTQMMRALRHEMYLFGNEPWCQVLIDELSVELPLFQTYWMRGNEVPATASAARALVPLQLLLPGIGLLQFRISAEPFTRDARFRMVYLLPADPVTMQQCAAWASARSC